MKIGQLGTIRDYLLVRKSELFDRAYYLKCYPDVAQAKVDPVRHFLEHGWKEGRNPSAIFNTKKYLIANKDVADAGINPLVHFLRFGRKEGRYLKLFGVQVDLQHESDFSSLLDLVHPRPQPLPPRTTEEIDIIVPVYNGLAYLKNMLDSLVKNTLGPYRLFIADDHSTDPAVGAYLRQFKAQHPDLNITLFTNEVNLGFVKTVNLLAERTRNHIVILTTDTVVPPNWLERLVYPILADDNIASATPFSNSGTICSFPDNLEDNQLFAGLSVDQLDSYFQRVDYARNLTRTPTSVGFCMAVNRRAYQKIGMFHETFGRGYGEENDWCMRAIKEGFSHVIVPNLFVYHKHGGSFSAQEKTRLMRENARLLEKVHPEYYPRTKKFIQLDPLADLRRILVMVILCSTGPSRVILDHTWGGGANEYTRMSLVSEGISFIIAPVEGRNDFRIIQVAQGRKTEAFLLQDYKEIHEIVDSLKLREVVINELVSFPDLYAFIDFLVALKTDQPQLSYRFIIHDFYSICPSLNLLDYTGKFCGIPENLAICDECLQTNTFITEKFAVLKRENPALLMAAWREKFLNLLSSCNMITCFSNSSRELLLKAYPQLETPVEVVPHDVEWVGKVDIRKTSRRLNIAIIGTLTEIKGAGLIVELGRYLQRKRINVRLHVFGPVVEPYNSALDAVKTVIKHYAYDKSDLPVLMERNQIDMVFISSICPETFSYATQEAIEMGIPLTAFDLGAQAERVKQYQYGLILEGNSPQYIVDAMQKYLASLKTK